MKSSAQIAELLSAGITAVKAGDLRQAHKILSQATRWDPANEQAWLWLSEVAKSPEERRFCIDKVLEINPHNLAAQAGRRWLHEQDTISTTQNVVPLLSVNQTEQGWGETLRRISGLMLSPALAVWVNARLTLKGISLVAWLALFAGAFGAYIWTSATDVPQNPGMRFLLGEKGLKNDHLVSILMEITGAMVWILTFGVILMKA
jgi:hypothetical protein